MLTVNLRTARVQFSDPGRFNSLSDTALPSKVCRFSERRLYTNFTIVCQAPKTEANLHLAASSLHSGSEAKALGTPVMAPIQEGQLVSATRRTK